MKVRVLEIMNDTIFFTNGVKLYSDHSQECCEHHELSMSDLTMADFDGLEFDLSTDDFFRRIPDYGIELVPVHGHSVKIPGYGSNNGYYGSNIDLIVTNDADFKKVYDVSECQVITD